MAKGSQNGVSNNPHGKPKGTKAKRTKQWEQLGEFITQAGAERAVKVLNNLPDEDFLDQYGKLLGYFKPKITHNMNEQIGTHTIQFNNTSTDFEFDEDGKSIKK
jgi:hypothetical protein